MLNQTTKPVPIFKSYEALQSLRDAGYSLPAALGELIDNAIEADANNVSVRIDDAVGDDGKRHIHRIAVADDGTGMTENIQQYYPVIGFSTRFMSTTTIGKYGVGAVFAFLNYAIRMDVWTRTGEDGEWRHVHFDLDECREQEARDEEVGVAPPDHEPVPEDLRDLLPDGTGTLVVWSKIDRLHESRKDVNQLRVEVEKELSRIFRYFLDGGIRINVNGTDLLPHDPLFRMKDTWADMQIRRDLERQRKAAKKAGEEVSDKPIGDHFPAILIADEPLDVPKGKAQLTVTLYPPEVTRRRGMGGDKLARRLRVPDNQGALSFVRLYREVSYTNVPRIFSSAVEDADRFIGIEVSFTPELDDYMGMRHVKRGVEPHDEFRAAIRSKLKKYVDEARKKLQEAWGDASREHQDHSGEHAGVLEGVKDADRTLPKGRAKERASDEELESALDDLAKDAGKDEDEEVEQYKEKVRDLPFILESVDYPGNMFMDIEHVAGKVIIRLNTRHLFYREMYEPLKEITDRTPGTISGDEAVRTARRTREALTLLLIAYGKAESMHETPREQYGDLRMYWGQFLDSLMGKVKDVI